MATPIAFPPPPIPREVMPRYKDEVPACSHTGPHAGHPVVCQGCGEYEVCGYCAYDSHKRYVCQRCYYRIDAWAYIYAVAAEVKRST